MLSTIFRAIRPKTTSASTAKSRLQIVVTRERTGVAEGAIQEMKKELHAVIAKYFVVDIEQLEVDIIRKNGKSALTLQTPVQKSSS